MKKYKDMTTEDRKESNKQFRKELREMKRKQEQKRRSPPPEVACSRCVIIG